MKRLSAHGWWGRSDGMGAGEMIKITYFARVALLVLWKTFLLHSVRVAALRSPHSKLPASLLPASLCRPALLFRPTCPGVSLGWVGRPKNDDGGAEASGSVPGRSAFFS